MAQFPEFRSGGIFRPKDAETHPLPDNTVPRTEHFQAKTRQHSMPMETGSREENASNKKSDAVANELQQKEKSAILV
jgi:hypothetical protein